MTNLFSIFDPKSWASLPLHWGSAIIAPMVIPPMYWMSHSQALAAIKNISKTLYQEFKAILAPNSNPGILLLPITLFMFILSNNTLSLGPFIFSSSSHLVYALGMGLPLWLGHILLAWAKTPSSMLAHLVPLGTPIALMSFMVMIELISNLIRPLTLSIRLAANMIAGHLLLSLLANQAPTSSISTFMCILISLLALGTLECAVSVIQGYVFSLLSCLYMNEVNSKSL